jgi:hypothetical protein
MPLEMIGAPPLAILAQSGHGAAMVLAALAKTCIRHPQRAGFALCMSCQQVVCQECATTWDGINYCRVCLAAKSDRTKQRSRARAVVNVVSVTAAAALLAIATAHSMVWALAMIIDWQ